MAIPPKVLIGAGIAFAGLGLIGAGAGATFTTQVAASTSVSTGGVGLSLNGQSGPGLRLGVDGANLGSHFAPITRDLSVKNTGTLDLASDYLGVTATGCGGGDGAVLARALRVTVVDVTHGEQVYDGDLCSWAHGGGHYGTTRPALPGGPGVELPGVLPAGQTDLYRLTLQPKDPVAGLPEGAQNTHTTVSVVFTGSDY